MGKGSFIAVVALLVAVAGAIVAFAAYFRRRGCALCEGMDEMMDEGDDAADLDYYATQLDDDEEDDDDFAPETDAEASGLPEEAPEPKGPNEQ